MVVRGSNYVTGISVMVGWIDGVSEQSTWQFLHLW